jgi:formylglycine-generating enzyme required for sulfatase activity
MRDSCGKKKYIFILEKKRFSDALGGGSDHLAIIRAFKEWEVACRNGRQAEKQFLWNNSFLELLRLTSKRQEKNHHMHDASQTDVRRPKLVTKTSCKGA